MTIVAEYSWESDTWTHNGDNPARQAWREAVVEIAAKAKTALPEAVNGRIEKAVAIVLNGDVEILADGKAKVASQSNGTTQYVVCNWTCECRDFARVEGGWCKHRTAAAIHKRAYALAKQKLAQLDSASTGQAEAPSQPAQPEASPAVTSTPLPEAPVSITLKATLHGHEVLVTLRGVDFASVKAQVEQASVWLTEQAPVQPSTPSPGHAEGWCNKHGVQMRQNHKDGRFWWSHWTPDGWCKGR
jgi:hypothetical protein